MASHTVNALLFMKGLQYRYLQLLITQCITSGAFYYHSIYSQTVQNIQTHVPVVII